MTIKPNGYGGFIVAQRLQKPVIYLDHWAIRMFSDVQEVQNRFIAALHRAGATWLFSQLNLFEFVGMTDLQQATASEALLLRAMPNLHVADMTMDKGYLLPNGSPHHPDAPDEQWILQDLGERAYIAGGAWNTHRFLTDCITHREKLLPLYEEMKADWVARVKAMAQDSERVARAHKFMPTAEMNPRDALAQELPREPILNPKYNFDGNDSMDLLHTLAPAVVCDFALLDGQWRHRLDSATKRLRKGGITGNLPKPYEKRMVPEFLAALEALPKATAE